MANRIRIGVLRGGPSSEHDVSLNTGENVLRILRYDYPNKYLPYDVFIDRTGKWYKDGNELSPHDILSQIDIAFNALHGAYGEDGKIQHILEMHHIPFTGSGSFASALGMNKPLSKTIFTRHGIKTPFARMLPSDSIKKNIDAIVKNLYESLILPVIVKPSSSGSSVGITVVKNYNEFIYALNKAMTHSEEIIIEDYIPGIEATCGVIEGFRGQELYALPVIEIRPHTSFFDYRAKYHGQSDEIVPATFPHEVKSKIEDMAKSIHRALGLRHYSRSDFIVHPRRGVYALEVNTLPGLTSQSLIPKALQAIGSNTKEFIEHLIQLAIKA